MSRQKKVATQPSFELARFVALLKAHSWVEGAGSGLTPIQNQILGYLDHANEFSRSPAALASWVGSTRGTISQTLKLLEAKNLVVREADPIDGRALRIDLTAAGRKIARSRAGFDSLATRLTRGMSKKEANAFETGLNAALRALELDGGHAHFVRCVNCEHFKMARSSGGTCALFDVNRSARTQLDYCQHGEPN